MLVVGALLASIVLGLAGCGGGGDQARSGSTTITFWNGFTAADRPVVEEIVANFNASRDDYQVEMTVQPWDVFYQKLLPAYGAGEGPTIAGFNALQYPGYASKGVLEPLDDFIAEWPDAAAISRPALDSSMVDGTHYGVPMSYASTMLYYNKELFAAAGVTEPPATLDELADLAVRLTRYDAATPTNSVYGLALPDHAGVSTWTTFMQANGGGVVSDDGSAPILGSSASVGTITRWTDLVRDQHISPVGLSGVDADSLFAAGKAAMYINGPWASTGFQEAGIDFGLALVPAGSVKQTATLDAYNMAVDAAASDEEKAGAREFLQFWNSREQQLIWALKTGFAPTRTDVAEADLASNPTSVAFYAAVNAQLPFPNQENFQQMNQEVLIPTVQRILNSDGTAAELLPAASEQIGSLIDR
jgi:multiple sugar transport system substrate-binding protein